jgi:hypothetical protein
MHLGKHSLGSLVLVQSSRNMRDGMTSFEVTIPH